MNYPGEYFLITLFPTITDKTSINEQLEWMKKMVPEHKQNMSSKKSPMHV